MKNNDVADWWKTAIIDMQPGKIAIRGRKIEELIGSLTFVQMIWLMLRGNIPSVEQASLLEAALVASVDHGPQSPSIAAARMAVTCGLSLNGAMGTAVHMFDDIHGGAGEQAVELFEAIRQRKQPVGESVRTELNRILASGSPHVPGYGHRYHKPVDPRAPRLLALIDEAAAAGTVAGDYATIARTIEAELASAKGKPVALNIDGASAAIYAELGFAAPLARGLFCLARSVGALAHGWEQMQSAERIKGPTPPHYRWTYQPPEDKESS